MTGWYHNIEWISCLRSLWIRMYDTGDTTDINYQLINANSVSSAYGHIREDKADLYLHKGMTEFIKLKPGIHFALNFKAMYYCFGPAGSQQPVHFRELNQCHFNLMPERHSWLLRYSRESRRIYTQLVMNAGGELKGRRRENRVETGVAVVKEKQSGEKRRTGFCASVTAEQACGGSSPHATLLLCHACALVLHVCDLTCMKTTHACRHARQHLNRPNWQIPTEWLKIKCYLTQN